MTRLRPAAALLLLLGACAGSDPTQKLAVSPGGSVTASGPILFTASPSPLADGTTWALTGAGTLSGASGRQVTYLPPATFDATKSAVLTASAGGQSATVNIALQAPSQSGVIPGLTGKVTMEMDAQGIPHVFCDNANDCLAAQGYLQARDRLFQMDLFRRTARGQLATLIGLPGVSSDQQLLAIFTNRAGHKVEDDLVANLDSASKASLQSYVNGVNAYLAFLAKNPTLMPGEYAQLPVAFTPADIPQWTLQDTLAIGRLQQFQLSESLGDEQDMGLFAQTYAPGFGAHADPDKYTAYVRTTMPLPGYTLGNDTALPHKLPSGAAAQIGAAVSMPLGEWTGVIADARGKLDDIPKIFGNKAIGVGSNNWVVDAAHSSSGFALVANDPHLSLEYPPLFHLMAMTAADSSGMDITGGSFPGIPGALVGRGKHVGWGVTVVGYDVTDIYLEGFAAPGASGCPATIGGHANPVGCVFFDPAGQGNLAPVPLGVAAYSIQVAGGSPVPWPVPYVPHHGPILSLDAAHGKAVSVRWTGHETTADFKGFPLGLNLATSVGNLDYAAGTAFAALSNYAVGAQNFVLADDAGHIGYFPHAIVPKRPWAGSIASIQGTLTPLLPWLPLPGTGEAEWGSGNAADNCAGSGATQPSAACWIPDTQLPSACSNTNATNKCTLDTSGAGFKGYLVTANADPGGYSASFNPLTGLPTGAPAGVTNPPYLSFNWDDPSDFRYARIANLLQAGLANSASGNKIRVSDMQAIQSDHQIMMAEEFDRRGFYPPANAINQPAYTAALAILAQWKANGFDCPTGLATANPKGPAVTDATTLQNSAGCLLFHTFARTLFANIFNDDFALIGRTTGRGVTPNFAFATRALFYILDTTAQSGGNTNSKFCNNVDAQGNSTTVSCYTQVATAMVTAMALLNNAYGADTTKWLWGRVHTLTLVSPAAPLVGAPFSAGPYARPGGMFTVDAGSLDSDASQPGPYAFAYSHGSQVRFVSQMGTDAASTIVKMQFPGAEHDGPHGVFADDPDLIGKYVLNQYFDYLPGHQVDSAAVSAQGFTAQ